MALLVQTNPGCCCHSTLTPPHHPSLPAPPLASDASELSLCFFGGSKPQGDAQDAVAPADGAGGELVREGGDSPPRVATTPRPPNYEPERLPDVAGQWTWTQASSLPQRLLEKWEGAVEAERSRCPLSRGHPPCSRVVFPQQRGRTMAVPILQREVKQFGGFNWLPLVLSSDKHTVLPSSSPPGRTGFPIRSWFSPCERRACIGGGSSL